MNRPVDKNLKRRTCFVRWGVVFYLVLYGNIPHMNFVIYSSYDEIIINFRAFRVKA